MPLTIRIPSSRVRRGLMLSASLAVTLGCSYLAVRKVHFAELSSSLARTDYWWLVPALLALAAGVLLRAVRWRSLYDPESRPPLRPVLRALLIGYFFNNILPARAGEAARVVALHRETGASRPETALTVITERAYDVVSLLLMLFVFSPWLPGLSWFVSAEILAAVVVGAIALAVAPLIFARERTVSLASRLLARLPLVPAERAQQAVAFGVQGMASILRPRIASAAFCWTIASWLPIALSYWLVTVAFHLGLSPLAGLLTCITIGLGMALPSSPGAVGVFEVAAVSGLSAYGVAPSTALSCAVVLHAVNFVPYIVAGAMVLPGRAATRGRLPQRLPEPAR